MGQGAEREPELLSVEEVFEALRWSPGFTVETTCWEAGQPVLAPPIVPFANVNSGASGTIG